MRHEDFTSVEVDEVLPLLLDYCQGAVECKSVHWLSTYGLSRVVESAEDTWQWTFSTPDMVGRHVISRPEAELWDLLHVWKRVSELYPRPGKTPFAASVLNLASASYYVMPVVYDQNLLGILLVEGLQSDSPVGDFSRLQPGVDLASKYIAFAYELLGARSLSFVDELTGLHNQRYLGTVLDHEIDRCKRDKGQFTLLFLDIDYFKLVNDGRGHWVGSKLLVELGHLLQTQVRSCDYAFRYGGDEFIILLGSSNAANSQKVAERIRQKVEGHTFAVEGHNLKLTVSIGLAAYPEHGQSASGLIQLADQAMYEGKRKSRNIVFVAS